AHLDILINIDGFNEIALPPAEYFGSRVNPLYPRSWPMIAAGLDLGEPTVILANIIQMHRNKKFWATKMQTELLQRSYFANAIWKMTNDITTQKISDAQRTLKSFENKKQPYFITGPSTHYENISEMIGDIIPTWKKSSIQLNKLCKANNIQYFHFLQPNQYYKKSKPIGEIEAKVALREDHPYGKAVKIGYPLLRNTGLDLKAEGIQFADLTQVFINHPEPLYEDDCCHFNQLGNDILATAVGRAVVAGLKAIPRQ
ncbi:MAG: hypothetical protein KDD38_00745, partial [Bdellovibrionales bacterium]|nr:hypothetical protein [Bdellovibrionales bacterium]